VAFISYRSRLTKVLAGATRGKMVLLQGTLRGYFSYPRLRCFLFIKNIKVKTFQWIFITDIFMNKSQGRKKIK